MSGVDTLKGRLANPPDEVLNDVWELGGDGNEIGTQRRKGEKRFTKFMDHLTVLARQSVFFSHYILAQKLTTRMILFERRRVGDSVEDSQECKFVNTFQTAKCQTKLKCLTGTKYGSKTIKTPLEKSWKGNCISWWKEWEMSFQKMLTSL